MQGHVTEQRPAPLFSGRQRPAPEEFCPSGAGRPEVRPCTRSGRTVAQVRRSRRRNAASPAPVSATAITVSSSTGAHCISVPGSFGR